MTADVSIHAVRQMFGAFAALDNIDLDIVAGEFVVLFGPSGCGKSTLLLILGGFISPTSDEVWIGGVDMSGSPQRAAIDNHVRGLRAFSAPFAVGQCGLWPADAGSVKVSKPSQSQRST